VITEGSEVVAVRGTPSENAQKWKNRLSAATPDIQAGINRVSSAPGQAAARQKGAWQANVAASADKWERNVSRVSLEQWKQSALDGVSRIAQGANSKVGKMESFLSEFQPHLERVQQRLASMPRGNLEQNLARMLENARANSTFKRSG
jgi:hypothetical protein